MTNKTLEKKLRPWKEK